MRLRRLMLTTVAVSVLLWRMPPALAHHSFSSEYDDSKPVSLTGAVTRIEWTNPHAWMLIDVPGPDRTVTWQIELRSPNVLTRQGWSRGSVKVGDIVTVAGFAAKSNQPRANAVVVKLPGGLTFEAAASASSESW